MIRAVADTHTFIWYLAGDKRISAKAREFIIAAESNGDTVAVSSISLIETVYLTERSRVPSGTLSRLIAELLAADSVFSEMAVDHVIAELMHQVLPAEIPDMPDRIVAATALHLGVPVISRDARIQASHIQTIW
jgi:PIN domain nuclease of toxin-antitoxin system